MLANVVDKNQIRQLIERKKAQVKSFEKDAQKPEAERTFSVPEYNKKISELNADIKELEAQLATAPATEA